MSCQEYDELLDVQFRTSFGCFEPGPPSAYTQPSSVQQGIQGPAPTFATTIPNLPHPPGLPLPSSLFPPPPPDAGRWMLSQPWAPAQRGAEGMFDTNSLSSMMFSISVVQAPGSRSPRAPERKEWQAFSNIDFEGLGLLGDPPSLIAQAPAVPPPPVISNPTTASTSATAPLTSKSRKCNIEENRLKKLAEAARLEEEERKKKEKKEREDDERSLRMAIHLLSRWECEKWRERYAADTRRRAARREERRKRGLEPMVYWRERNDDSHSGPRTRASLLDMFSRPGPPDPDWFEGKIQFYKNEVERLQTSLANRKNEDEKDKKKKK